MALSTGAPLLTVAEPTPAPPEDRRPAAAVWRFANVIFDESAMQLVVGGNAVEVERRPLELLLLLLHHAGEVVTKDEIFEALWPDRIVTEASLTKCMARLRQVLRDDEQRLIRTVHGYGYRFAAAVSAEETTRGPRSLPATMEFKPGDAVPRRPNWLLVERLGVGGFGDAWLGEQAKTHERRVFKFALDAARLAALRREIALVRLLREGLGQKDDFTRILDWSLEEPPYFIETEWSTDGNLADWAERCGGAAAVSLTTRLDIVAQTADALAAAHSMGVLHKDLKPANILIQCDAQGYPRIRLSDFGSGRAMDPGRWRELGVTGFETGPAPAHPETSSGTPVYRAPELLSGGAPTVQADIYSLGVVLYQFVIGDLKRALAPGWERDVSDELLREDIAAAAAGNPELRLGNAADLAKRLRSLEARRAQRAKEQAALAEAERTKRDLDLARARRVPLLALIAALFVGLAISTWLYLRAENASRAAHNEAARAQAVTKFLTDDLLSAANPFLAADPNISVKDLLASAGGDLEHRFNADPLDRASIELAIGRAYDGLSLPLRAAPLLNSALGIRKGVLGDADPQTQQVRLAIANMHQHNLDMKAAKAAAQEVLDIGHHTGTLDAETELRARYDIAYADCQLKGNEQCIAPLRSLLSEAKRRLGARNELSLEIESALAFSLGDAQRFKEAIPMAREALALTRETYGPGHLLVQDRKFKLAEVLSEAGQVPEAIQLLTDVRQRLLSISGAENEATARAANQLAKAYVEEKHYAEALALFRLALNYHIRTRGDHFVLTLAGYNNVANTLAFMGREKEAIAVGQKTLELQRADNGPDHPDTIWFENNLANFYDRDGNFPMAEATYRDVLQRAQRTFKHGEWDTGHFAYHLGAVLAEEKKNAEARIYLREAVGTLTSTLGKDNPRTKLAEAALNALPTGPAR